MGEIALLVEPLFVEPMGGGGGGGIALLVEPMGGIALFVGPMGEIALFVEPMGGGGGEGLLYLCAH